MPSSFIVWSTHILKGTPTNAHRLPDHSVLSGLSALPCHFMSDDLLCALHFRIISDNHYWAARLFWCKPGLTAKLWNCTHWRGKLSEETAERQLFSNKRKQMCLPKTLIICSRAAQINCLILTDMMADHLGQNDVCDAPFPAVWLCPFVFMPSLKQRVRQFRNPPKLMSLQAGVSCPQADHSSAGGQQISVK